MLPKVGWLLLWWQCLLRRPWLLLWRQLKTGRLRRRQRVLCSNGRWRMLGRLLGRCFLEWPGLQLLRGLWEEAREGWRRAQGELGTLCLGPCGSGAKQQNLVRA